MSAPQANGLLSVLLFLASLGGAQPLSSQVASQLVSHGRGEARVAPDRATVELSIETRSADPAEARRLNARKEAAVLGRIRALGIPASDVTTVAYLVGGDWEGSSRDRDNVARSVVRITLRRPEQVGSVVDSALAAGATRVASIEFASSREAEVRRTALAAAITEARADAEAMARAAGGTLGPLVELTTEPTEKDREEDDSADGLVDLQRRLLRSMSGVMQGAFGSPITPTDVVVAVRVRARWLLTTR
jgi:uncharacterized protein YggE